jgi:hypothetical protein
VSGKETVTLVRIVRDRDGQEIRRSEWAFRWWHPGDVLVSLRISFARWRYLRRNVP